MHGGSHAGGVQCAVGAPGQAWVIIGELLLPSASDNIRRSLD